MATHWGRKETIIWPPHVPLMSYSALAAALLLTCLLLWQRIRFAMPPLEQAYIGDYMRARAGAAFHLNGSYRLVYLGGGKAKPRLAFPFDFTGGTMILPNGKTAPFALAELPRSQGYKFPFRAPARKYTDASMYRWFHDVVFEHRGLQAVFAARLIGGGIILVGLLAWAIPADIKRFRQMKYGRVLRGPVMLTPRQFNRVARGEGVGFVTTESRRMMRIPRRKEAQHIQIMGDTGVGKTQLIMQILRQIRDRKESAIVYDPACEYIQRFFDNERGDIVLNPLDDRCPYWGPAQEMESNAEADAIAASLYQRKTDVIDEFFHDTPAQIIAQLKLGPTPHQLAAWMASDTELLKRVAGTEMAFYIDRKAGPQRAGVLSSLGLVAKGFRLLPEKDESRPLWTARTWAKSRQGWIFITSQTEVRDALRPLQSLWIDLLVMRLLTAPQPGQRPVWFVIDELASLQKLQQLHTAITESRKSKNPLVLGFQGKAQLEVTYGHLAEVMLSQPATKIFMKTAEPKAAEWISEAIGKVEIERLKETKFDGTRSGKNFTVERQIEPLVMGSEISGLDDRHAYLKLGNSVARFAFDYLDLPTGTTDFIPRKMADGGLSFNPDTLEPIQPEDETDDQKNADAKPVTTVSGDAPIVQEKSPRPIPWPVQQAMEQAEIVPENPSAPVQEVSNTPVISDSPETQEHSEDEQISLDLRPL